MEGARASAFLRLEFLVCASGFLDVGSALGRSEVLQQWNRTSKAEPRPPARVFYINLNTSVDRRAHMEHELSQFPGQVERVDAVRTANVSQPQLTEMLRRQGLDEHLAGLAPLIAIKTVACWLSHVLLWQRLLAELGPTETALVLEDDVKFPEGWHRDLNSTLLRTAPPDWVVLKLCGWGWDRATDVVDENWSLARWPLWENGTFYYGGSCGYLVSGATLPRLLQHVLNQPVKDIDVAMMVDPHAADASSKNYTCYEQRPRRRLFMTGGFRSTIRGSAGMWYEHYFLPSQAPSAPPPPPPPDRFSEPPRRPTTSTTTSTTPSPTPSPKPSTTTSTSPVPGDTVETTSIECTISGLSFDDLTSNAAKTEEVREGVKCTVADNAGEEIQCDDVDVEFLPGSVVVIATITPPAGASVPASSLTEMMKEAASTVQQDLLTTIQNIPDIDDFATGTLEVSTPAVSTVVVPVPDSTPLPVAVPVPVPTPSPALDKVIPFGTADGAQSSMQLCSLACVFVFLSSFMWG